MAIYSLFGVPLEVTDVDMDEDGVMWVKTRRPTGKEREYRLVDLRADGGLPEIMAAIDALEQTS